MLRGGRFLGLWIISFLSFASLEAQESVFQLNLNRAVDLALSHNPEVLQAKESLTEGKAIFYSTLSNAGPEVTGVLDYRRQKDSLLGQSRFSGETYNSYSLQLQARQSFLRRGYFAAIAAGQSERRLRELNYQLAARDVSYRVVQAFYRVLFLQEQLDLLRETKKVFERNLKITERRQRIGQSQRLDVLKLKAEIALIDPQIEQAENNLTTEKAFLANELALPESSQLRLVGGLEVPPLEEIQARMANLESFVPEIARVVEERKRLEKDSIVQLGSHWPKLEGVVEFGRSGFEKGDIFDSDANSWQIGLSLNIPIFSSFLYLHDKSRLDSVERQKLHEEQRIRNFNAYEQVKSREDLSSAYSVIRASRRARDLVSEALQEARRYYELARINYLELLDSEQSLLSSEVALLESSVRFVENLTQYFEAHGYPAELLIEILSTDIEG